MAGERPSISGTTPDGAARTIAPALAGIVDFFETIRPETVAQIPRLYSDDAFFKDPFNEVHGSARIQAIFEHMFAQVDEPRFVVQEAVANDQQAFLIWDFHFTRRSGASTPMRIHGASHLRLDALGRIVSHRDYWDVAEELYEKLPLLGSLMRWLKRQAQG